MKGDVVKVEKGSLNVSTEKGSIKAYKPEDCPLQNPQTAGGVEVHGSAAAAPQIYSWKFAKAELTLHAQKAFASVSLLKRAVSMHVISAHMLCPLQVLLYAGHDHVVLLKRAWRVVEPESAIPVRWHLHIHRLNSDSSEPICIIAIAVWSTYDATVQRPAVGGAVTACLCHCRFCLQADAKRQQKSVYPGVCRVPCCWLCL